MSGNLIFTLGRVNPIVMDPSVKSTHLLSATLVEQGSVLDHRHRTGGGWQTYTDAYNDWLQPIMHSVLRSA